MLTQRERNDLDRHITGNYGEDQFRNEEMFDEQDPFDFIDNLLETFSEDQLCLLEQRIFSAIARKRSQTGGSTNG